MIGALWVTWTLHQVLGLVPGREEGGQKWEVTIHPFVTL